MSQYRHLNKAPITEALIDIQVHMLQTNDASSLIPFGDLVKEDFPKKYLKKSLSVEIPHRDTGEPSRWELLLGFAYESPKNHRVVQSRLDGFTFSQLKRYETWEKLTGEAKRLWDMYLTVAQPESIKRIAVRFINSMEIELPIDDYLKIIPLLPPALPQGMTSSLSRIVVKAESDTSIILTQSVKEAVDDKIPVILDIDVFRHCSLPPEDEEVWEIIESFHEIKNAFFFEGLHQRAWEPYL